MRIVAGEFGGRVLKAPPGQTTRPTSEKVREAIFAILGDPDPDDAVLDLFAGSGAVGLEALSRGAARATFVDKGPPAIATLRGNVAALGVAARAQIVVADAVPWLGRHRPTLPWQLVFIDPPYRSDLAAAALTALGTTARASLAATAVIVVEHDRRNLPPAQAGSLVRTDERRYGDTYVSFFRRSIQASQDSPP